MTKFLFVRDEKGFPVGCFSYEFTTDRKNHTRCLKYGYSVFNPKDHFNKRHARVAAEYRMIFDPAYCDMPDAVDESNHVASLLARVSRSAVHFWATDTNQKPRPAPLRFRKACLAMAKHFGGLKKANSRSEAA